MTLLGGMLTSEINKRNYYSSSDGKGCFVSGVVFENAGESDDECLPGQETYYGLRIHIPLAKTLNDNDK